MPRKLLTFLLGGALIAALSLCVPASAGAQDAPVTGATTQDIVPKPNSGTEPTEAGDRGGALQLLVPVVMAAAIGGAVVHVSRQSRRARSAAAGADR